MRAWAADVCGVFDRGSMSRHFPPGMNGIQVANGTEKRIIEHPRMVCARDRSGCVAKHSSYAPSAVQGSVRNLCSSSLPKTLYGACRGTTTRQHPSSIGHKCGHMTYGGLFTSDQPVGSCGLVFIDHLLTCPNSLLREEACDQRPLYVSLHAPCL